MEVIDKTNSLIGLIKDRGYGDKDRLFRKLSEEVGEVAEALEYAHGATRKVAKFKDKISPKDKFVEEVSDVIMVGFALARAEGLLVEDVLEIINRKLWDRENEYKRRSDET